MRQIPEALAQQIGDRYRLDRAVGEGGMATVYLAHDHKIDRAVVVKVMRPDLVASDSAKRFLREIQVTARLQHPQILPLLDSGVAAGTSYYVVPFVAGGSLRDRLEREGALPTDVLVRVVSDVADALDYAHANGVIHRDIKPENILLEGDRAIVADFGVARAVDEVSGTRLTSSGIALGTPAYMSPEHSESSKADARSDLYSLGCVLYEMLSGHTPFGGRTPQEVWRDTRSIRFRRFDRRGPTSRPMSRRSWQKRSPKRRPTDTRMDAPSRRPSPRRLRRDRRRRRDGNVAGSLPVEQRRCSPVSVS